jgi:hypothetical protein
MNQPINDGGPAFPVVFQHDEATSECYGISIRDYFAAAALEKASRGSDRNADEIAKRAFYIADAMLKAREVKP